MSDYGSVYVECPFFIKDDEYRIKCEGTQVGNKIHLVFGSAKKKKEYSHGNCCENFQDCRIYKMLIKKYK